MPSKLSSVQQYAALSRRDFVAGSARRIELLRACCDLSAGVEHAMARAHELVAGARARLAALPASPAREALDAIALFTLERRF